jgi:pyridine nucleotide-disulfide oxidoreductase family protein
MKNARKRLLLLGAGHAHVHVLKTLGELPLENTDVTLVTPYTRQVYSGMLPGWIAGHYRIDECVIPIAPLATRAGVKLHITAADAIDVARNVVKCTNGEAIEFDVVSIDTGPVANLSMIPGAAEYALALRPIEAFIEAMTALKKRIASSPERINIAFVGAGAGGIEVALALQYAFADRVAITLISAANTLPGTVGPRLARIMQTRGVRVLAGVAASRIEIDRIYLANGEVVKAEVIIAATGASAADWPRESALACDDARFILINQHLQSISHPQVFAAGDCATMQNVSRPKSGVYAVRAGPPLAENLRRYLSGESLTPYLPQARSLYLISTGNKHAIGSWGNFTWAGDWVWRWKDRIDRGFMAKYSGTAALKTLDSGSSPE